MNNLNVQHYTNEHSYKVTQITENIEKQMVIAKVTNYGNKAEENIGHFKLKRGRELNHDDVVVDDEDIQNKVVFVRDVDWISDEMKDAVCKLIEQLKVGVK
ncbi:hypothetical protein CEY16_03125 [Halalkalibacillus sediminis]|uniref:Uncharacterized protein n=1 Tax=Halalkalibacillus sediminis TaxID=2018042 RepID=A0A2I0QWP9_9BACI|nr:hypothetical protein [Halalkalibacillus sediminis]PKR78763.1 hypothetical protein CEY16_03125 [Halalkalibacillus sediminis]